MQQNYDEFRYHLDFIDFIDRDYDQPAIIHFNEESQNGYLNLQGYQEKEEEENEEEEEEEEENEAL